MANIITLPGLIDVHVHFRDPGQTQKEDFYTGTCAALAGGFTTVIDMPNNLVPITTKKLLNEKIKIARQSAVNDIGFHFGSLGDNINEFSKVAGKVFGLKLFLNQTTGNFIIGKRELEQIYNSWNSLQPILLHAEEDMLDMVFQIVKKTKKKTHICHVSSRSELLKIMYAKEKGLPVTCGITPHHLFLSLEDAKELGPYGMMKPYLKSKKDAGFIWDNFAYIDIIESDHAPHTKKEKETDSPFGVPGLETTLPLLLTAAEEGKTTVDEIIQMCHINPAKIFNIPTSTKTYVDVEMTEYEIQNKNLQTKCGWSPFEGRKVVGKVKTVVLRGEKVYENNKVITRKGNGRVVAPK